jgi:hypothetical protein
MSSSARTLVFAAALALSACGGFRGAAKDGESTKLYLDEHHLDPAGVSLEGVAEAHKKDLAVEGAHGVRFLEYWVDEAGGRIHCLVEAPDAQAVVETHREAHGLLSVAVHEVVAGHLRGGSSSFLAPRSGSLHVIRIALAMLRTIAVRPRSVTC